MFVHSGKFYIFVAEDADTINQYVILKKTKLTKEIERCSFPDHRIDDYMRVFKNHQLNISTRKPYSFTSFRNIKSSGDVDS